MKFLILALAVACAQARPDVSRLPRSGPSGQDVPIFKQQADVGPEQYSYAYETGNGISAQEEGQLKTGAHSDYSAIAAKGSFSYTSPKGEKIQLTYVADKNGFQPQGSYVPEIPEAIARSLKYIATHQPPAPGGRFPAKF